MYKTHYCGLIGLLVVLFQWSRHCGFGLLPEEFFFKDTKLALFQTADGASDLWKEKPPNHPH